MADLPWLRPRELAGSPDVPWLVRPYIARGAITEIVGRAKAAGKSTFLLAAVAALIKGNRFLGQLTKAARIAYLTEEHTTTLQGSLEKAGLMDTDLRLLLWGSVWALSWSTLTSRVRDYCKAEEIDCLIVDTLPQFALQTGAPENDALAALAAVRPLQRIAHTGVGVVFVRHERKAGGAVGQAGRGSSAYGGSVDIMLRLQRRQGKNSPLRMLTALSRFPECPEETLIELTKDGYALAGNKTPDHTAAILTLAKSGTTLQQVMAKLHTTRSTAQRVIAEMVKQKILHLDTTTKRGELKRYVV